eukprot:TRINITY_DN11167_c0_g2_i1.p1 TRINITY_DN11167_c0_g2~~TRINITY_DN11167_c0_g2_i1.p1  ORF type:complete len:691 (+),score=92.10 TRINITY_DN11167_c0_g2_i1:30-2075(+)
MDATGPNEEVGDGGRKRTPSLVEFTSWSSSRAEVAITWAQRIRAVLKVIVQSESFECAIGVLILTNCITLGFEAEVLLGNMLHVEHAVKIGDHAFTLFFTMELALRVWVLGWRAYLPGAHDATNFFDAILVVVTFAVWALPWLMGSMVEDRSPLLRSFTVLRCVRIMRLARVVQRVPFFREVWLLLRGLTHSIRVLFWTITVITFITYVFAIFGVILVSVDVQREINDLGADGNHTSRLPADSLKMLWGSTGSVTLWMFTFIQVLTLDSWNSILRPLLDISPFAWVLFYLYIAIAVVVLLNLVTAIIVENAFKCAHTDEEEAARLAEEDRILGLHKLKRLFEDLDDDGSGEISWEEFETGFWKPEIQVEMKKLEFRQEDLKPMFELLDTGDGSLSMEEFFEGIQRVRGPAMAKETFSIAKRLEFLVNLVERQTQVVELLMNTAQPKHPRDRVFPAERTWSEESSPVNSPQSRGRGGGDFSGRRVRAASSSDSPKKANSRIICAPNMEVTGESIQGNLREFNIKLEDMTKDFRTQLSTVTEQVSSCMHRMDVLIGTEDRLRQTTIGSITQSDQGLQQISLADHDACHPSSFHDDLSAGLASFEKILSEMRSSACENGVPLSRTPILLREDLKTPEQKEPENCMNANPSLTTDAIVSASTDHQVPKPPEDPPIPFNNRRQLEH